MNGSLNTPAELLRKAFCNPEFAEKTCLLDADTGESYTYADMENKVARAVPVLWDQGVHAGDTVSLLLENGLHFFAPWLGAMRVGAVVHPINTLYTPEQILYALNLCQTKLLIAEYSYFYDETGSPKPLTFEILKARPELRVLLMRRPKDISGHQILYDSWEDASVGVPRYHGTVPRKASDAFQFICTSGTTGSPKAVVQHNGMFLSNVQDLIDVYEFSEDYTTLLVNRLFHVNAQVANFFPMALLGGTTILLNFNRDDPEKFWNAIKRYGVAYSSVIPPMLGMIENAKKVETPSLQFFIVGADILTPERHETFVEKTGVELRPGWGMTETLCWGSATARGEVRIASIGKPLPRMHMKIVDPDNNWKRIPKGTAGRLIVKGSNVFKRYFRNDKATQEAFMPSTRWGHGWFDTGDTVYQDTDGTFFFVCRSSADSWKMRGEFVVGPLLDEYLEGHPNVEEAVSVPLMMNEQTETVMLVVAQSVEAKELWQYCEEGRKGGKLEGYYKVKGIVFVKSIELGDTGKRSRKQMAARLEAHYGGEPQEGWGEFFDFSRKK